MRELILLLSLVTLSTSSFEDADSSNTVTTCKPGEHIVEGTKCQACPAGTKAKSDQSGCDDCPLDTYSTGTATVCTKCDDNKGTIAIKSTKADDCVTVCKVPTVAFTDTGTTAADTRLESGKGTSTVKCKAGYTYGNALTTTITCDVTKTNNGYPTSCRKIVVQAPSPSSIKLGEKAIFTCNIENGDSTYTVSWFKGDQTLNAGGNIEIDTKAAAQNGQVWTRTSELTFKALASTDAGTDYSCKMIYADPILSDRSASASLTVLDIVLDPAATTQIVTVGGGLSLECKMTSDPNYAGRTIEWYFNGSGTAITDGISEGTTSPFKHKSVTKSSVAMSDAGTYECKGTYSDTSGSNHPAVEIKKTVTVYVRGFTANPQSTFKEIGSTFTLSCSVKGDSQATIIWKKTVGDTTTNPSPQSPEYKDFTTTSKLAISTAQASDTGSYKCEADFSGTKIESTAATVTVEDIGISEAPVRASFLVGEDASLVCKVKNPSTNPATAVYWVEVTSSGDKNVDNKNIEWGNQNPVGTATLKYASAKFENAGKYKCKAEYTIAGSKVTRESAAVDLFIRELSVKLEQYTLVKLPGTTTKTFACTYKGDDGAESITWTLDGKAMPSSGWKYVAGSYKAETKLLASTQTVESITKASGGVLKCTVNFKSDTASQALSSQTTFVVHSISASPKAETVSAEDPVTLSCTYSGTNDPNTVQWRVDTIVKRSEDDGYEVNTGTLKDNDRTTTIKISGRKSTDKSRTVTCEFIFSDTLPADTLTASTKLIYRGIVTKLNANYYTIGQATASFTCALGVGSDGAVPHATEWYFKYNDAGTNTALPNSGNYAITTDTAVNNGKFETVLKIAQNKITIALAGKYRCRFKIKADTDEKYESEGNLDVRLVTIAPSTSPLYSYKNAGLKLSCTLESTDTKKAVSWTGPNGAISSGLSTDSNNPKINILTLPNNAAAGQYSCKFTFEAGATFAPTGKFADVNVHLLEMKSPTNMYSTYGADVKVTFTCQVTSPSELKDLNFHDGTKEVTATRRKYENGKTTAEYDLTVDTKDKGGEYKCWKSADEVSSTTSKLTVMKWKTELPTNTPGKIGAVVNLACEADWNAVDANKPVITWLKGSTPATETKTDTEDTSGKTWVKSVLPVTLTADMANVKYTCTATYTGLVAGKTITTVTTIKVSGVIITPAKYQIKKVGETAQFTCVVEASEGVNVKWRKRAADYTDSTPKYTDLTTAAEQEDYDTKTSSRKSTLTLGKGNTLKTTDSSDSIECYDEGTGLTDKMELNIVEISLASVGVEVGKQAVLTCTVSTFDKTPTVAWFKKMTDSDTPKGAGANPAKGRYEYTIAATSQVDNAVYYCKVTYKEMDDIDAVTFKSAEVNLFVRQFSPTPTTPVFIHTGETISLDCSLNVLETTAAATEVKWYKDGTPVVEVANVVAVTTAAYAAETKIQKSTYTDKTVDKNDGGKYKCEYTFAVGEKMSFEITVHVHLLTALKSEYVNPTVLDCVFEGSNQPTISWWTDKKIDPAQAEFAAFSFTPGTWTDKSVTDKLNIDLSKLKDTTSITCKVVFSDGLNDPLQTATKIQKREISSKSETTYALGAAATLSCVLSFGASGTGPTSVEWTQNSAKIADSDTEKKIEAGINKDGSRTTTLTFPSTKDVKFAGTYTCKFKYSDSEIYQSSVVVVVRLASIVPETKAYISTNAGFSITCTFAGGETPGGVSWTRGEKALETGKEDYTLTYTTQTKKAELSKTNPSSADDGVYKCKFTMETAGDAPSASTTITVGLLTMTQPEKYYGAKGGKIVLDCTMKIDTKTDIYWFKDNVYKENAAAESLIGTELKSTYTIAKLVAADHDGVWSCSLSKAADQTTHKSKSTKTVTLKTFDFIQHPPAKTFGTAGAEVKISCKTSYGTPGVTVKVVWLVNDGSDPNVQGTKFLSGATNDDKEFASSLTLAFTSDMLEKSYSCKYTFSGANVGTTNSITSTSTTITQMAISGLDDVMYIKKGKKLSISCTAYGGSATTIKWTHNGLDYTKGIEGTPKWVESTNSITSKIVVESVDTADDGNYVCLHSGDNSVKDTILVDVYEVEVTSKEVQADSAVVLTCSVKGITKPFTFAWTYSNGQSVTAQSEKAVDESKNQKSKLSLTAPKTDTTYICTVSDPLGQKSDPLTLKLNVFEITTTGAKVKTGETAVITCEISGITKTVTVVFNDGTKDLASEANVRLIETGAPLGQGATKQTAKMTLYNVQTDATFTCKVTSGEFPDSGEQKAEVAVSMFGISIDVKYAIKKVGDSQVLVCTGDGDANIQIVWTESGKDTALSAVLGDYNNKAGTRTSTLSFTNLKVEDSKEYICTVTTGQGAAKKVTSKARIDVVSVTTSPDVGKKSGDDAVFSCDYNTFSDATPVVKWFKKNPTQGQPDQEQSAAGINNSQKKKSILTLAKVQFAQSGDQFYCQVAYQETASGATKATNFNSDVETLYVREPVTTPPASQYIHAGKAISLVCNLKIKSKDELESVKWFIGTTEVKDPNLFKNADFDVSNMLQKTTYTDSLPDKTEGGKYKCEYSFKIGDKISFETAVSVHLFTAWPALTINEKSLKCEFKGTNQPTFKWYTATNQEVTTGGDSPFSIVPGSWADNAVTSTLNIDKSKYLELKSITCKITFAQADITDPHETTTAVHFREISKQSETTYTTGEDVKLSCTFDFTKGGVGPTTVKWSGIEQLTKDDEYTVELGTNGADGKRETTLTLKDIDDVKYAKSYKCSFEYSDSEKYESQDIPVLVRVVKVDETQYSHTPANFKITCKLIGTEKPTAVKWTHKKPNESGFSPVTSEDKDFDLALVNDKTEAVLTKGSPVNVDAGEYICQWEFTNNPTLKPTGKQNLIIALLEMPQKDLSPINRPPNVAVTLTCTVLSEKSIDIFWYKGDQFVINLVEDYNAQTKVVKSEYKIEKFANSNIGEYSCRLDKDGTTNRASRDRVVLKIQGLETVPAGAGSVYLQEKQKTSFSCKISNKATITWTKDGSKFEDSAIFKAGVYDQGSDSTTSTLTFESVTKANEGVYICTYETLSATFTLDTFGVEVTNKEVKSGAETELICRVTDTKKVFSFAWTDADSKSVTAATDSQPNEKDVQESKIKVTSTKDTTYKCVVNDPNGKQNTEATITLNVFEITNPTEVMAIVGAAVSLTCGVTGNTGTPTYKWYKVGRDDPVYTDPGNGATSTFNIAKAQFSDDGAYKCTVAMKVGDFTNDGYDSGMAEVVVKQLTASFEDKVTVKKATDTLVCTYKGDNDVSTVVWNTPSGTAATSKVKTDEYSVTDKTVVSTFTFTGVGGKDGGEYSCTFSFKRGTFTPMTKKTTVTIAVLTPLDALAINKDSLDCVFVGTYNPSSVKWYTAANQEVDTGAGSAYSITPGTWKTDDNSIKSTLNIKDKAKYTEVVTFTCKVTFSDTFPGSTDGLQTQSAIHYREIQLKSETTYSTGNDVTISCVFYFTKGGIGPTSVEWSQIENLKMSDDYLTDLGSNGVNGKRTTSLTLKGIDDPKFAALYTCGFKYDSKEIYTDSIQVQVRVAKVDQASQYVHTNKNFKITCDFKGKETPSQVKWSLKKSAQAAATTITAETKDFGLELLKDKTQAILTKSSPVSADDGEYTCEFEFTEKPLIKGTAKADIVVALLQMPQHTQSPINKTPGQKVVLTCTVKSEKQLDIYWYKGTTQLDNKFEEVLKSNVVSSELTIASFSSSDVGAYSCRLDNDGTLERYSEQTVNLKLQGLATTPAAAGTVFVENTKPLTLKCKIDNKGVVTWTKNGDPFTDASIYSAGVYDKESDSQTSSLTFTKVSKANEGVYVCTYQTLSATFTVDTFDLSVTSKEVKSGAQTVLTCTLKDITAPFTFSWTDKNSKKVNALSQSLKNENHEQKSELTVTPTEDTSYTCTVKDASFVETSVSSTLNVFEITKPSDVYAVVGEATSLQCGVTGHSGTPTYAWYKQGADTPVFTDSKNEVTSTYNIASPQFSNDGVYYCKVAMKVGDFTNDGFDSETGNLVIRQLTTSFGADTVVKESKKEFVCTFKGDDDVSSIEWKGPKGTIPTADKIVTSKYEKETRTVVSTFTLSGFDGTDGGAYTCTFNFNKGAAISKSTNVVIYILKQLDALYFNPDHIEVNFKGTLEPSITWFIGGSEYKKETNTQLTPEVSSPWANNAVTFKLTVKMSAFGFGMQPFTVSAKLKFGDKSTEELVTQDAKVYKRALIHGLSTKYTITADQEKFTCEATGEDNKIYAIKWYLDDKLLEDSQDHLAITEEAKGRFNRASSLTVDNTRDDFNGKLKCSVTWPAPAPYTIESTAEVVARGAYMEKFSYTDKDGNGVMVCNAWKPVTTSVTFTWKKPNGDVLEKKDNAITITETSKDRMFTSTVKIVDMKTDQNGDYKCEVKFDTEQAPRIFTTKLQLLSAKIEHNGPDKGDTTYIDVGAELKITCTYSGEENPSKIEWLKGTALKGSVLTANDITYQITTDEFNNDKKTRKSVLLLKKGIISESGVYTCKWTVSAGAPTATLNVRVMGWEVTGAIGGKTYGLDGTLVVACKYTGIQPGTVTWQKGETTFKKGDKISITGGELSNNAATYKLTISDAVPGSTEGKYTCVMTYDDGYKKSANTEAVVRTAAVVEGASDTAVSSLMVTDGTLAMKCVYKGKDQPKGVSWFYGSTEIKIDGTSTTISNKVTSSPSEAVKVLESSVGLGAKTLADEGKYSCRFHLNDGQDPTAEADVKVVSVTTAEECVFIDYGSTSKETMTCTYTGSSAALSFAKKFPNKADLVAGELSKFENNKQTGSFELIDITNEKGGTYECVFGLADNKKVSKEIKVAPRKAEIITSVGTLSPRLLARSSITITCTVASGAKSITWFKGATELSKSKSKYEVVEETSEKSSISFDIASDSGGDYTCKGLYFSDDCPTQHTFASSVVKLEVITDAAVTQPKDVFVNEGDKAAFSCVFKDPYGESKTPVIQWRVGSKLLLNGDLYNDAGVKVMDGEVTNKHNPGTYTTILSIAQATMQSVGEYMCTIKWDALFIHSNPAHLVVRRITTAPSTVNVPNNLEARLTCVAVADTKATITFHLASDDSSVSTVESSDDSTTTKTSMVTTTGVLKIPTATTETSYYCKATWSGHSIKSASAYVNVLNYDAAKVVSEVWEAVGNTAKQSYYYEDKLMASKTAAMKGSDGRDVYAVTSVVWQYDKSGTWTDISDNSKITAGSSHRDSASPLRVTEVNVGPLTSDQTEVKLAAKITYTADTNHNVQGGTVDTKNHVIKVRVIRVTSFQLPTNPAYKGDTITLSCSATGPSKPTFKFTVGGLTLSGDFFTEVVAPTSVVDGSDANLFKSEYKISVKAPNVLNGGQSVVCEAEFPSRTVKSESKELKTYYKCDTTESKAKITLLKDTYATKTFGSLQADGSLTASTQCKPDTASQKYTKAAATPNSGATSTCSRDTGMWTPNYLVPCLPVETSAQAEVKQKYDLSKWVDPDNKYEICNDKASGDLTKAKIVEYLTSTDNAKCGARHKVPCLKKNDGSCKIKDGADNAGCSWDKATKKLDIFVIIEFTPAIESVSEKLAAVTVPSGDGIVFFKCDANPSKRNAMLIEILDRGPVDTECVITNSTVTGAGDSTIDMIDRSHDEKAAKLRLILIVGAVCFAAFVILATTLFVRRRKSEKSKTLNIEIFPGKLVISDA